MTTKQRPAPADEQPPPKVDRPASAGDLIALAERVDQQGQLIARLSETVERLSYRVL